MPDMDLNLSRVESILEDTLGYDGANVEQPKSRVERLLIDLNDAISTKQDALTFDTTPTANSTNPVTSGGIYTSIQSVSSILTPISQNDYDALATKTLPLYFVYEDDSDAQNSNAASLTSMSPLMMNLTDEMESETVDEMDENAFSFSTDTEVDGNTETDSTFDFFSEEES